MKGGRKVDDRSCGIQLQQDFSLLPWATEVATHGTFMLGLDKVEDMSKLEPGKLHELTLVLSWVTRRCLDRHCVDILRACTAAKVSWLCHAEAKQRLSSSASPYDIPPLPDKEKQHLRRTILKQILILTSDMIFLQTSFLESMLPSGRFPGRNLHLETRFKVTLRELSFLHTDFSCQNQYRWSLNTGRLADRVGVKFPIFAVNLAKLSALRLLLTEWVWKVWRDTKTNVPSFSFLKKNVKNGEFCSDGIYTNTIKNFPKWLRVS